MDEKDDIRKLLNSKIDLSLPLGPHYERPIDYIQKDVDIQYVSRYGIQEYLRSAKKFLEYYRHALGWIKANPSEKGLPEAMSFFYIFPKGDGTEPDTVVNLESHVSYFVDFLRDFSEESTRKDGYLVGKMGVGKTYFINYILNCRTPTLFMDDDIMWYRIDASKVYRTNISVLSYLYMHVVYVSIKYPHACRLLYDIEKKLPKFINFFNDVIGSKKFRKPSDLIEDFKKIIFEIQNDAEGEKSLLNAMFVNDDYKNEIEVFGHTILKYLETNNVKLIFIFDGIDNIDYYTGRKKYDIFLGELMHIFGVGLEKNKLYGAKNLITLRDETYSHIMSKASKYARSETFGVKCLTVDDIVNTKIDKAIHVIPHYFKNRKDNASSLMDEDEWCQENSLTSGKLDKLLKIFVNDYVKTIINKLKDFGILNVNDILRVLYNENIRAFINNMLNTYEYKLLFEVKRKLINRDYIILEAMFLDGTLFIDSARKRHDHSNFPNIFYYSNDYLSENWHGLCGIRILQLLKLGKYTKENIKDLIARIFNYEEDIIEEFIDRFCEYGLITTEYDFNKPLRYRSLPKGSFFLKYSLANLNYLYFLSIDTPLSYHILDDRKCISVHEKFWLNYVECAIKTTITMIRHIKSQILKENQLLKHNEEKIKLGHDKLQEIFSLGNKLFLQIISQMVSMVNKFQPPRQTILLRDLEGIQPAQND